MPARRSLNQRPSPGADTLALIHVHFLPRKGSPRVQALSHRLVQLLCFHLSYSISGPLMKTDLGLHVRERRRRIIKSPRKQSGNLKLIFSHAVKDLDEFIRIPRM